MLKMKFQFGNSKTPFKLFDSESEKPLYEFNRTKKGMKVKALNGAPSPKQPIVAIKK